jgi:hypothetical protein
MFKPLNQLCYSEHQLALDHDKILSEVVMAKIKDDVPGDRENYSIYPKSHTLFEDSNIYDHTASAILDAIQLEIINIFGAEDYFLIDKEEIWGHVVEPGQQTTIHSHVCGAVKEISLSFAYYPNHPTDSGDIIFQTQINTNQYQATVHPRKGMAIIFDSSIYHHTPANCSKYTRVSVSGNLVATPKLIEELERDVNCDNPYWKYSGNINI